MSAVAMVAAFSLAMDENGVPPSLSDKIIDAALRIAIERDEKAVTALRDSRLPILNMEHVQ